MGKFYDLVNLKYVTTFKWLMACILLTALLLVCSVYSYWVSYFDTVL